MFGDDTPDGVMVDPEIVIHQDVPHAYNPRPRQLRHTGASGVSDTRRRFTDYLNTMDQSVS